MVEMSRAQRDQSMLDWTKRLAIYTGALFFVSAVGTICVGIELWQRQGEERDKHEQLRAFMNVSNFDLIPGLDIKTLRAGVGVSPNIKNVGATRTRTTTGWISIKYFDGGVPNALDTTKSYNEVQRASIPVGPNGTLPMPQVVVNAEDVLSASVGEGQILAWGKVDYTDIYSEKVHALRYCILINVARPPGVGKSVIASGVEGVASMRQFLFTPAAYQEDCNKSD